MAHSSITYADKVENNGATPAGRFGADDLNEIKTVTNANGADFDGRIDLLEAGGGGINNLTSSGHVGDGTTVTFPLSFAPQTEVPQAFVVGIDGVLQSPIDAYTVSTTTDAITFSSAPPVNAEIVVSTANVLTGTDISASTIISTGSTTTRLLADRFADTLNLKDFGVIYNDRSSAILNSEKLNAALIVASNEKVTLNLGSGVLFLADPIVQTGRVRVIGSGTLNEWSKVNNPDQGEADTVLVMIGSPTQTSTVAGVSSMYNWGAGRINPSERSTTHNDSEYRLLSFVEDNTLATGRTLKKFSAAWTVENGASGSSFYGFRVIPDYGGTEGMDGYSDDYGNTVGVVSYPLSSGEWDVGLHLDNTRSITVDNVQFVGQWRMAGLLGIAHAKDNPAALYKNRFIDCTFNGYHGVEIRGYDGAPVIAQGTTTIDIPWADDHPFGADGDMELALTTGGVNKWPSRDLYTFTGMTKVTGGAYDVLRLTGISPNVPADVSNAFPYFNGGGTSQTDFERGEIMGFQHPSREPCHIKGLAGVVDGVFAYPSVAVGVSGTKATEIWFHQTSLTGYEEVMAHVHDCRNITFDVYVEANRAFSGLSSRGGRVIFSPEPSANPHSLSGNSSAGTQRPIWKHRGSTLGDGSLDTRPSLSLIDATYFTDVADVGFMESFYLTAPLDPAHASNRSEGEVLISSGDRRAGLGRRSARPPFSTPDEDNIDWSLRVDPTNGDVVAEKPVVAPRFNSVTVTIDDDDVAVISSLLSKAGFVYITHAPEGSVSQYGISGQAYFDIGNSAYALELLGGADFTVLTTALTGTTGADGDVTVGVDTGNLYLENRYGSTEVFTITVIG